MHFKNYLLHTYYVLGIIITINIAILLLLLYYFSKISKENKNFHQSWKIQYIFHLGTVPIFRCYFSLLHALIQGINSLLSSMFTKNEVLISVVFPQVHIETPYHDRKRLNSTPQLLESACNSQVPLTHTT
jgi:hypothetical protein